MSEAIDPVHVVYKIQRLLDEIMENNANVLIGGGVDNMEKYRYIIGQINGLEAVRQELSNLLNDKEQNEKGTVININTKQ